MTFPNRLRKKAAWIRFQLEESLGTRRALRVPFGNRWVALRPNTPDVVVASQCLNGAYGPAIDAARPLIHNVIVDAGAYIGVSTVALAEAFPDARILAIEPDAENFRLLVCNTRHLPNVIALPCALGGTSRTAVLGDRGTGAWGYSLIGTPMASRGQVHVTTLPELLQQQGPAGVDLLKLDIEGAEAEVLENAQAWMPRIRVLVAELHDRIDPRCTSVFQHATSGRRRADFNVTGEDLAMSIA